MPTFEQYREWGESSAHRAEYFRKRNADIARNYKKWGDGTRLAKKYGITQQRVQEIARKRGCKIKGLGDGR